MVSPTGGSMRRATGCDCAFAAAPTTVHASARATQLAVALARSEPVRVIARRSTQRLHGRAGRLTWRNDASELSREERLHILGALVQGRVARANDFLFRRNGNDVLHPA